MKWFKHDSDANRDAKLQKVRIKYGMEGYGLYWFCLEHIVGSVEVHNLTFELEHDAEILSYETGIHIDRINEMMSFMSNLELFENNDGQITCLKIAKRLDQSMTSNPKMRSKIKAISNLLPDKIHSKIMTASCQSHDGIMIDPDLVMQEEKRREEKRVSRFTPPTYEDINKYAIEKKYNLTGFFDYYCSNGWKVGKNQMKSWHSAAAGWNRRQSGFGNESRSSQEYGAHGI